MTNIRKAPAGAMNAYFALALQGDLPTLPTRRLILRAPRVVDFEVFARIACSQRGQFLGGPMAHEDAWAVFSGMTDHGLLSGHGLWTIGHSGATVGFVRLGYEPGDDWPELAVFLDADAEGRGIASEAARAARAHAFDTLGWTTLAIRVALSDTRARALAHRLGGRPAARIALDGRQTLLLRKNPELF